MINNPSQLISNTITTITHLASTVIKLLMGGNYVAHYR